MTLASAPPKVPRRLVLLDLSSFAGAVHRLQPDGRESDSHRALHAPMSLETRWSSKSAFAGSNPAGCATTCSHRLLARTSDSQSEKRGSIPRGSTTPVPADPAARLRTGLAKVQLLPRVLHLSVAQRMGTGLRSQRCRFESCRRGCGRVKRLTFLAHNQETVRFDSACPLPTLRVSETGRSHKASLEDSNSSVATGVWLNLARALGSGPRDWWFESTYPDHDHLDIQSNDRRTTRSRRGATLLALDSRSRRPVHRPSSTSTVGRRPVATRPRLLHGEHHQDVRLR